MERFEIERKDEIKMVAMSIYAIFKGKWKMVLKGVENVTDKRFSAKKMEECVKDFK
jgi:hypothetical protein